MQAKPNAHLPGRESLLTHLASRLGGELPQGGRITLHYLDGKVDVDLFLDPAAYRDLSRMDELHKACTHIAADDPYVRAIHLHRSHAQE
jgi:hypothetical protein